MALNISLGSRKTIVLKNITCSPLKLKLISENSNAKESLKIKTEENDENFERKFIKEEPLFDEERVVDLAEVYKYLQFPFTIIPSMLTKRRLEEIEEENENYCKKFKIAKAEPADDITEFNTIKTEKCTEDATNSKGTVKVASLEIENQSPPIYVTLGPHGTTVPKEDFDKIDGMKPSLATRHLLRLIFSRETLATHTFSGAKPRAFGGKPTKPPLDPLKVADLMHCVQNRLNCSSVEIRLAITTMCSDAAKRRKRRDKKL